MAMLRLLVALLAAVSCGSGAQSASGALLQPERELDLDASFRLLVGRWDIVYEHGRVTTLTVFATGRVEFTDTFGLGGSGIGAATPADAKERAAGYTHRLQGQYTTGRYDLVAFRDAQLLVRCWDGSAWRAGVGQPPSGGGCHLGERVRAFMEGPGCEPEDRRCWRTGTVADGPDRGDAYLTILWAGRQSYQRMHASLVRRSSTGLRCLPAHAVSTPVFVSQWGHYRDGAFDQAGRSLIDEAGQKFACDRDPAAACYAMGQYAEVRSHYCPGTCAKLDRERRAQGQCFSPRRTLPLLEKYARWRWHSQRYQDAVLHFLLVRADGVPHARLPRRPPFFVEFGSMGLQDSNTQYLRTLGWNGVVFDIENVDPMFNLTKERITPSNVVEVFQRHGVPHDVDLVAIDIDSCDVWVFLSLTGPDSPFRPRVMLVEYNRHFEIHEALSLDCSSGRPPWGDATDAPVDGGAPNDYVAGGGYGSSLLTIARAAASRGYTLVWVESCFDAVLVRSDLVCEGEALPSDLSHLRDRFGNFTVSGGTCEKYTWPNFREKLMPDKWWISDFHAERYA